MTTSDTDQPQLERWLTKREVLELTTLKQAALSKRISEGRFPRPVPLNDAFNRVVFRATEVAAWQRAQIVAGRRRAALHEEAVQKALEDGSALPSLQPGAAQRGAMGAAKQRRARGAADGVMSPAACTYRGALNSRLAVRTAAHRQAQAAAAAKPERDEP